MDAEMKQMIQDIVNMDYSDLAAMGRQAFAEAWAELDKVNESSAVAGLMLGLASLVIGADNVVTDLEVRLFNDITGLGWTTSQVKNAVGNVDYDLKDALKSTMRNFTSDVKTNLLISALVLAAADETAKAEELRQIFDTFSL